MHEASIGEALRQTAETFGRLMVQHLQLLRSELEEEGRALASKGRAVAACAPFILTGIIVVSLALGQLAGVLLQPWLGQLATPLATLGVGLAEALLAGSWLRMHLRSADAGAARSEQSAIVVPLTKPSPSAAKTPPMKGTQEKAYGAMG